MRPILARCFFQRIELLKSARNRFENYLSRVGQRRLENRIILHKGASRVQSQIDGSRLQILTKKCLVLKFEILGLLV
jgi:hypothetical protein